MKLLIKLVNALFCIKSLFRRGIVVVAVVAVVVVVVVNNSKLLFLR
jgi:hypothetical protein